jgi:bacillithiol synthase
MPETACREQSETIGPRFQDVPFSSVPGQSKLFLQYLADPESLRRYYPSAVPSIADLVVRKADVLANHQVDRDAICDILAEQNSSFGAKAATGASIAMLRESDCVAVLTGQQAGLFSGPLYTIYKVLSAIRVAEKLRDLGVKAVPVFWMATEDHDFEEVSNAFAVDAIGGLTASKVEIAAEDRGKPVGSIRFDKNVVTAISEWFEQLSHSEFSAAIENELSEHYSLGSTFGTAFGCLLTRLFSSRGLIVFDPLDERIKKLATPIYETAIKRSKDIMDTLRRRSDELAADGFQAQVLVEENYFPLFWTDEAGRRVSVKRSGDGKYRITGSRIEFNDEELLDAVRKQPSRFSPGVMLRPVVQDFLFPTICYIGGGAEIAYFAQNSEVYRIVERPVTPIFHRESVTIVEPKHARTLEKYGLKFEDVFRGFDALLPEIIERVIDPETPRIFADVEERINTELNRLDRHLSPIDPTLAESLAKRRRKIIYHIGALRTKFERARIEKDEIANRRLHALFTSLFPNDGLQERTLNFASFANHYGVQFVDWIYESIDVDSKDHRVVYF